MRFLPWKTCTPRRVLYACHPDSSAGPATTHVRVAWRSTCSCLNHFSLPSSEDANYLPVLYTHAGPTATDFMGTRSKRAWPAGPSGSGHPRPFPARRADWVRFPKRGIEAMSHDWHRAGMLECWNNGIVECWVFHVPTNCPELGLFRTSNFTLQTSSKIGFVCTTPHVPRPPGPGPPGFARKLALFFQCSLQVRSAITPFPQTTCASSCRGKNWVCLARSPSSQCPAGPVPAGGAGHRLGAPLRAIGFVLHDWPLPGVPAPRYPILPKFGFVFPVLFAGQLSHNPFPANHLPFALPWPKLGLFVQQKPLVPRPSGPAQRGVAGQLALFPTNLHHRGTEVREWPPTRGKETQPRNTPNTQRGLRPQPKPILAPRRKGHKNRGRHRSYPWRSWRLCARHI